MAELAGQRLPGPVVIEDPRGKAGDRRGSEVGQQGSEVTVLRRNHLPRLQHCDVVRERLAPGVAAVLRRREGAGRDVEQGHAVPVLRARSRGREDRDPHQEHRLPIVEIRRVGERAGGYHPHDLALHDAPGLPGVFDLLADGDAKPFLHQAGQVGVGRVVGHAAHRNRTAGRILRPGRQGQIQRPGRGDRVFVEHLVEVAHPEEHDGVRVLPLRVHILAHGGGRSPHRRGAVRRGGSHGANRRIVAHLGRHGSECGGLECGLWIVRV